MKLLKGIDALFKVLNAVCRVALFVIFSLMWLVVFGRYFLNSTPVWTEELVLFLMAWVAMLSGADSLRNNAHLKITIIDHFMPDYIVRWIVFIWDVAITVACSAMFYYSIVSLSSGFSVMYAGLKISKGWVYLCMPIAYFLIVLTKVEKGIKMIDQHTISPIDAPVKEEK